MLMILSSCINEYHIVKKNGNGYDIGLIVKIPQYLVKKANDENGGDVIKDMEKEIRKEYGKDVKIERGSKDENYILNASFYVDEKSNSKVKKMLPRKKGNQLIIPLDYAREYEKKAEEGASYGNPTYTLFIEKEVAPLLKSVVMRRKNGNAEDIKYKEDDGVYVITIPLKRLLIKYPFVEVVLTMESEKDYINDFLKSNFSTYIKLQDAYFSEENTLGNLDQIGMLNKGYKSILQPNLHSFVLQSPISISSKMKCSEFAEWTVRSILSNGSLCFEIIMPDEPGCKFTSTLCRYATAGKCGFMCPEPDKPTFQGYKLYFEKKNGVKLLQCKEDEYLYWILGSSFYPNKCVALPQHSHKVNDYMKTETKLYRLINLFGWECDFGYSRDRGDSCIKWPKGAIQSEKCWVSTIDTAMIKERYPNLKDVIMCNSMGEDVEKISLAKAFNEFRGRYDEKIYVKIKDVCEELERVDMPINDDPSNTSLGPYSGCWECPEMLEYDDEKNECVPEKKCTLENLGMIVKDFICTRQGWNELLIDSRDGKRYKTFKIENRIWMAENLNFEIKDEKCCEKKVNEYGEYYPRKLARNICPTGWHLPTTDEWHSLIGYASVYMPTVKPFGVYVYDKKEIKYKKMDNVACFWGDDYRVWGKNFNDNKPNFDGLPDFCGKDDDVYMSVRCVKDSLDEEK